MKARKDFETVHVGSSDSSLEVEHMSFWQVVATNMKVFLNKKAKFTAIAGLGHRRTALKSKADSLLERSGIQKFSVCLVPGLNQPGYITFNPSHNFAHPAFRRLNVKGEDHWAVSLDHVTTDLHGTPLHSCWTFGGQHPCTAIIDSGTTLIGVPPNAVVMVRTLIKRIKYDCSNLDELPDLVFELDGKKFPLPARAYTVHFGMKNGKPYRCLPAFTDVSMSLQGANVWILGLPFLRHFYTVFDRQGPSIYVANQADDCEPALADKHAFIEASEDILPGRQSSPLSFVDLSEVDQPSWVVDKNVSMM